MPELAVPTTETPSGGQVRPGMPMSELLEVFPGARRALFRKYHIGGCSSCAFDLSETLEGVCQRNGNLPPAEVIAHIERSHLEDLQMQISPEDLASALKSPSPPALLDIRTREEFDTVHLPGAIHFTQELLQEMLMRWPREGFIVLYDHLGKQGLDAAAYFQGHGFKNVKCLAGGIDAWAARIDPKLPRYRLEQTNP